MVIKRITTPEAIEQALSVCSEHYRNLKCIMKEYRDKYSEYRTIFNFYYHLAKVLEKITRFAIFSVVDNKQERHCESR